MKKVLVASILGMALSVASSYGQGYIQMQSYDYVGTTPVYSGVTYGSGPKAGEYVGDTFSADLLYSSTGAAGTFNLVTGSVTPFYANSSDGGSPTTDGAGIFTGGPVVTLPGYSGGPAYLEVQAFNGTGYGLGTYDGTSAVFTISDVQTSSLLPAGDLLDLQGGTTVHGLQPFVVNPVPEPSIFALSSIGAAALMLIRRKKIS